MKDFVNPEWRAILSHNHLETFDQIWSLEAGWFEEPNHRRGGWSGVSRVELALPGGGSRAIFLKRQENHGTFSLAAPRKGVPTFLREFHRIERYRTLGIPALVPVYFAMRTASGGHRAILATEELAGYASLDETVNRWLREGAPTRKERQAYLRAVAALLRRLHAARIQHSCFFPKHIYTRLLDDGSVEARVIDLEKSRWRPLRNQCAARDLYSLFIQSLAWSRSDRLWFFKEYLGLSRLNSRAKRLWREIGSRVAEKGRIEFDAGHTPAKLKPVED